MAWRIVRSSARRLTNARRPVALRDPSRRAAEALTAPGRRRPPAAPTPTDGRPPHENLALRHQLTVLRRSTPRPRLRPSDLGGGRRHRPTREGGWHRTGFKLLWTWKSRRRRPAARRSSRRTPSAHPPDGRGQPCPSPKPHPARSTTTHALVTSAPRQEIGGSGSDAGTVGSLRRSASPPRNGGGRRRSDWRGKGRVGTRGSVAAGQPGDARSGRLADVAMMKTPDFGNLHDRTHLRPLDGPPIRRILLEREVSSRPVIVGDVARQDATQVAFVQDEDVIQTLAPDRADEPFREGVLPRAGGRGQDFGDLPCPSRVAGTRDRRRGPDRVGDRTARSRSGRRPRSAGPSSAPWGARSR